ncbi:secretion regulating guanine nucleotide exchange [Echinococcus multilocularis]|uniref:Secretion regulating guanine nucleotide exchange n=1 Tax=Echinococcus multilocularis TaxID=6211 RepID=A0A068Y4F9_ECHMU|nr:secretion regulating guanine nucleotide exchange [Echinococcus multilocularis]
MCFASDIVAANLMLADFVCNVGCSIGYAQKVVCYQILVLIWMKHFFVVHSAIWAAGQLQPREELHQQTTFRMVGKVDEGIKALSCGWEFFIVLSNSGKLYFRGCNRPGFAFDNSTPSWVGALLPIVFDIVETKHIAAGLHHVVAVSIAGIVGTDKVYEWKGGKVREVVAGNSGKIVGCVAGAQHSVLWTDDGCVGVWGDMRFGQGGPVADEAEGLSRKTDRVQWISSSFFLNEGIVDVQSGWSHILVLTETGEVFSWGRCDFGQLGRTVNAVATASIAWPQSGRIFDPTPHPVALPTSSVRLISAGAEHCLAVVGANEVWVWGWNEHGNCGIALTVEAAPVVVEGDAPSSVFSEREDWCVALPRLVSFVGKGNVLLAAASYGYSMALKDA